MRILLTGVTGLVGSCLAPLLQENNEVLCLIRPDRQKDAHARLVETLPFSKKNIMAINGDVTLPKAGMKSADIDRWKGKIDKIVHGAASIRFDEPLSDETKRVNVGGTQTMLDLARELEVKEFHFLSTVYVAGSARSFTENDFDVGQTTRNAYEKSKLEAERLVRNWNGGKFSVHRMSIVIGDATSGYVKEFNGYYGFFVGFWRLRNSLYERWLTGGKDRLIRQGISFDEEGFLELPLSIDCSPVSKLNLVNSNWLARILNKLISLSAANQTFHLVHPSPPRVQWVIEVSLDYLKIRGIQYRDGNSAASQMLRRMQRALDRKINRYLPYVTHEPIFGRDNLLRTLGESYVSAPAISESMLQRMLDYAIKVNFGQKNKETSESVRRIA
ncbi:MAG: SDR family oxidoreductase [Candidatus Giovannonibacteria bacterium]|nr:MAG: SDR family oxidoreductase [Candidatus Giovannonibacteria bacterium]